MKNQLIFLGPPGSGKGTQASRLKSEFGYQHLSTGDLLRQEVSSGSPLGKKVEKVLNTGHLVDNSMMLDLIKVNCDLSSSTYIFDGFPRTRDQAQLLDAHILLETDSTAIYFDMELNQLFERLGNRRVCTHCGATYNLKTSPSMEKEICKECGKGELAERKDDNEKTIEIRLDIFKSTIEPILDYYQKERRLQRIDASQEPDVVYGQLKGIV